jgi:hypothetical protein
MREKRDADAQARRERSERRRQAASEGWCDSIPSEGSGAFGYPKGIEESKAVFRKAGQSGSDLLLSRQPASDSAVQRPQNSSQESRSQHQRRSP